MKFKNSSIVLLVGSALSLLLGVAFAAQDRFTLKSPNGIAFSEFRGYDTWQVIAPSQPDDGGGCGSSPTGCIKSIVGNTAMIQAYNAGIPLNGKAFPDGAAMAKIEWSKKRNPAPPYGATVPGPLSEVSFMVKDSKRFSDTNGWGWATFRYDPASNIFKPFGDSAAFAKTCQGCHTLVKARDFVFTDYAKR